jgi:hypothetical protein
LVQELTMLGTGLLNSSRLIRGALVAAVIGVLPIAAAHATPITYTFTGVGSGTANGVAFTDTDFTFVFTADTSNIDASGAPFFDLHGVGGTFTEGSYSATLAPTVTIVATEDASFPRINFFNADVTNGLGLNNSALATYDLSTSIGPITTPPGFLTPTFPAPGDPASSGFATLGDGAVIFTADESLVFTAALQTPPPPVPEPSSIVLMTAGVLGMGLIYRRSRRQGISFGMNSIG